MTADLPTALLPRKTILYLTSHSLVLSSNIQLSIVAYPVKMPIPLYSR
jgi:hypothetical protein